MMAAAVTGPTPGRSSSSVSPAELMLMSVVPPAVDPSPDEPGSPLVVEPGFVITICVPSVSGAARFNVVRSAPFRGPPARSTASMTRSPGVNSYTPGSRTHPATSTMIAAGLAPADPVGPDMGYTTGVTASTGAAMATGRGNERMYQRPAPRSVATTTTTSPASSPRDNESSRSRIDMRGTLRVSGASRRDEGHSGDDDDQ